jgi:ATP-dependent Lon protease
LVCDKDELGEGGDDEEEDDVVALGERLSKTDLPEEARKVADRELQRMKRMQPAQPEYNVIRTYLENLADLPWGKKSRDRLSPDAAMEQLNLDHYGLEKVVIVVR